MFNLVGPCSEKQYKKYNTIYTIMRFSYQSPDGYITRFNLCIENVFHKEEESIQPPTFQPLTRIHKRFGINGRTTVEKCFVYNIPYSQSGYLKHIP
jgi:hypothetical protein